MAKLTFKQLVNIELIQHLLEAHFKITGSISAILDTDDKVLAAAGWQDICTRFHCIHIGLCNRYDENDTHMTTHLPDVKGEYPVFKCKKGLRSIAVPIIIAGKYLATFSTNQFFYDDDKTDVKYFRTKVLESGFDEECYLEALNRVPVYTREQIHNNMDYYWNLVQILVDMGLKNLELFREVKEQKRL